MNLNYGTMNHSSPKPADNSHLSKMPTRSASRRTGILLALLAAVACFCAQAHADPLPPCAPGPIIEQAAQHFCAFINPGGSTLITPTTTATITYTNTAVTNTVNDYSTTLVGLVNGTQVYSSTFLVPFSDPSMAAAIASANGILSGYGASFGAPSLSSSTSVLQSSVVTPPVSSDCLSALATGQTYVTGTTVTSSTTFGPAEIMVGDCSTDTLAVNAGQTSINVITNVQYTIPVQTITTDTYLNSQTYDIIGTTGALAPVPEPASLSLVLSGFGAIGWLRRRRIKP